MTMKMAKPHLDVGLMCSDIDASRDFYCEGVVGLPYEELLPLGSGMQQHRLGLHGGVLKLNASRAPFRGGEPSCLRALDIVRAGLDGPVRHRDPDGLPVRLVPPGFDGIETIRVTWASSDPQRLGALLARGLGAEPSGDDRWSVGRTSIALSRETSARHGEQRGIGFRYLTVQVFDVHAEHARLVDLGWTEGSAPVRLGDIAAISFVRDPDGVWLEVSQRASLTGALPSAPNA